MIDAIVAIVLILVISVLFAWCVMNRDRDL